MDALAPLTDGDLAALAAALRSGRLQAPFSPVAVGRYAPPAQAVAIAHRLQQLHEEGMQAPHLALLAETVARTRAQRPREADWVDLVWTGPETLGVTNRDTGVVVRDLFGEAEFDVLVAGFAVHQGREVFKRLSERMTERPSLRVKMFLDVRRQFADTSSPDELLRRFARRFRENEWPGAQLPALYYDPRSVAVEQEKRSSLHAKCVVIDRRVALVTSANFTEAAHTRNLEVGALIRCPRFAARLAEHFEALAENHSLLRLPVGT
ncbi:MAG TPA: DISARM system phospholipase D-like protein DrmC [Gemmataceae bacterium]|nr:DISARM system phospholipase D-like protein DrmC [Gemmataceae bacterium]